MNPLLQIIQDKIRANPAGLYVLFYTEMWELFGRFSITALLVLYLTLYFHVSDATAFGVYSAFIALLYTTPIVGGFLTDRFLGSRHAIIFGASLMCLGNALLVIPDKTVVFVGLAIIAVGSGFFLPNIPPMLGALYTNNEERRDAGFILYYLGKNIGALLGPVFCGIVGHIFGWNYAFMLSTLGMVSGLVVFVVGQKHLRESNQPRHLQQRWLYLPANMSVYALVALSIPIVALIIIKNLDGYLLAVAGVLAAVVLLFILAKRSLIERKHVVAILIATFFVIIFESFLGQGGTTLNLFIQREVNRHILGVVLPTSFFYALNPVFMLMTGPFLAALWIKLARSNKEPLFTTKFGIAMFLLALGFLVFVIAAIVASHAGSISLFYVVLAYFIFPVAELCIVPISLSLVTKLAPKGLESLLVGVWMLSNAASGYFIGVISSFGQVTFSVSAISGLKQAALIYHHLFLATAICLLIAGVIAFALKPVVKRLVN